MNAEKQQAELLEQYLNALAHNPNAPVPPGLADKTAAFARSLIQSEDINSPAPGAQSRVWHQIFTEAQPKSEEPTVSPTLSAANGRRPAADYPFVGLKEQENIFTNYPPQPGTSSLHPDIASQHRRYSLPLVAALLTGILIGGIFILANTIDSQQDDSRSGAGIVETSMQDAAQSPTPTPDVDSSLPSSPVSTSTEPITVAVGETYAGTLNEENPAVSFVMNAQGGDLLMMHFSADHPLNIFHSVSSRPGIGDGTGGSGGGGGGGGGGNAEEPFATSIPLTIDNDSIISIEISSSARLPNNFTFQIDPRIVGTIAYGETLEGDLHASSDNRYYRDFEGQMGDIVTIRVEDAALDLSLELYNSSGERLTFDDDSGSGHNPEISNFQLAADDTYRIVVQPYFFAFNEAAPTFALSLDKQEPLPLDPESEQVFYLTSKNHANLLSFQANAGQTYRITASTPHTNVVVSFQMMQNGETMGTFELLKYEPMTTPPSEDTSEASAEYQPATLQQVSPEFTTFQDGIVTIYVNSPAQNNPEIFYPLYNVEIRVLLEEVDPGAGE